MTTIDTYSSTADIRPAPAFVPPTHFYTIDKLSQRTFASSHFSKTALSGKQLWHISVPAGMPIQDLKEISWDKAMKGEPIIDYKSESYGIISEGDIGATEDRLMVLEADGYHIVPTKLSKVLQIRRVVGIPDLMELQQQVVGQLAMKQDHVQPKGLRMRYKTSGAEANYDGGAIGDSESDVPEPAAKRQRINGAETVTSKESSSKRNRDEGISREKPPKKSRKIADNISITTMVDLDAMEIDSPTSTSIAQPAAHSESNGHKEKEHSKAKSKSKDKKKDKDTHKHRKDTDISSEKARDAKPPEEAKGAKKEKGQRDEKRHKSDKDRSEDKKCKSHKHRDDKKSKSGETNPEEKSVAVDKVDTEKSEKKKDRHKEKKSRDEKSDKEERRKHRKERHKEDAKAVPVDAKPG